jgi:hypothetical protein
MDERRRETRRKLMAFTPVYEVYELHPRLLLGYLGDLTLKGALVIGTKPAALKKEIRLKIEFPSDLPGIAAMPVEIPSRIAWCRQDEHPQNYSIGIEFLEVTVEQAELFEQILTRYHFRHAFADLDFPPVESDD